MDFVDLCVYLSISVCASAFFFILYFIFACLFSKERDKEQVELGGWRGREDLGGDQGG